MHMKEFVITIPASSNPLADICGKPVILHTYEQTNEATTENNY